MTPDPNLLAFSELFQEILTSKTPPAMEKMTEAVKNLMTATEKVAKLEKGADELFDGPPVVEFFAALPKGFQYTLVTDAIKHLAELMKPIVTAVQLRAESDPVKRMQLLMSTLQSLGDLGGFGPPKPD